MKLINYSLIMILLLTILPFISCGSKQNPTDKPGTNTPQQNDTIKQNRNFKPNPDYKLQSFQVIIKPSDSEFKEIFGDTCKSWAPEESNIETAEKLLNDCFETDKRGTVDHLLDRKLEEYNRQYVGAINKNGDKIIWINCFARPEKDYDEWKHKLIIAKGGGTSFFNLMVNITKYTYADLKVNGNK